METYVGEKIQMATTSNSGVINDHLDTTSEFGSDVKARKNGDASLRRYSGCLRRNFNIVDGPVINMNPEGLMRHPRNYQNIENKFVDLGPEDALKRAMEIAKEENVVLYLEREHSQTMPSPCFREIMWHPEGWEPQEG